MINKITVSVILILAFNTSQSLASDLEIGCVDSKASGCGCRVLIEKRAGNTNKCAVNLFSGIQANSPINVNINNEDVELPYTRYDSDDSGSWTDSYARDDVELSIKYTPSESTCPKDKVDRCEYTDHNTDVVVTKKDKSALKYQGKATCGC